MTLLALLGCIAGGAVVLFFAVLVPLSVWDAHRLTDDPDMPVSFFFAFWGCIGAGLLALALVGAFLYWASTVQL